MPPEPTEYGYGFALKLAREKLAGIRNLPEQCRKCGAICTAELVRLSYLSQPGIVDVRTGEVSLESGENLTIRDKILVLDYLTQAKGTPLSGKAITYKELPDGIHYFPVFYKRAIKPIVTHYGTEPEKLLEIAGAHLAGTRAVEGDLAVRVIAFPRVAITFVLWKGDDEFGPEGNILFDSNISDYLTNEDINVLCEIMAWKLVRLKIGR